MIVFDTETKDAYKSDTREIKTYGILYLAKSHPSKNYFNVNVITGDTITNNGDGSLTVPQYANIVNAKLSEICPNMRAGNTYTLSLTSTSSYKYIYLVGSSSIWYSGDSRTITEAELNAKINIYGDRNTTSTIKDIIINDGTEAIPYEEYGKIITNYTPFELTEENECKILSFTINEKTDLYYTSMPYNTMTLEIDNEKGYFTDYDPDSIVNKLNSDCYVDIFMNINDGEYYKIMTMNFNEITYSDYYKAKISFKSSIAFIKNLPFRDNTKLFNYSYLSRINLATYFKENFNLTLIYSSNVRAVQTTNLKTTSVENMLLECATYQGSLENVVFITNNSNNEISLRGWLSSPQETITKDYELEKPTIKKENTYQGVNYRYINSSSYETTTETYLRTITGNLAFTNETIVFRDNDYKLNDITINNLSITGDVSLELQTNANANLLLLTMSGNIGQEYTITITKDNIKKRVSDDIREINIGSISDTTKVLKITETSPLNYLPYNLILNEKKIRSYVEVRLMGLPYIEVGDTIEVEIDNAKVLITISEIEMEFGNGLIQKIKGYELGWETLFPSNTLYPSNDLYPNMTI